MIFIYKLIFHEFIYEKKHNIAGCGEWWTAGCCELLGQGRMKLACRCAWRVTWVTVSFTCCASRAWVTGHSVWLWPLPVTAGSCWYFWKENFAIFARKPLKRVKSYPLPLATPGTVAIACPAWSSTSTSCSREEETASDRICPRDARQQQFEDLLNSLVCWWL